MPQDGRRDSTCVDCDKKKSVRPVYIGVRKPDEPSHNPRREQDTDLSTSHTHNTHFPAIARFRVIIAWMDIV